jgi:hypothetical protein
MADNFPAQTSAGLKESLITASGTTPSLDCSLGNNFKISTTGNTTFTFSNPAASGEVTAITLVVTQGGSYSLTWPASVDWPAGSAPSAPASGAVNSYVFMTNDGGTTWYGFLAGEDLS